MLQIRSSGHISKLKQRLIALSVQFVEGIVEIILILKLTDVLVSLKHQKFSVQRPIAATRHRGNVK